MENFQLRTYAFINSMQPQFAAFLGSELDGDVPLAQMAELWLELAPGSEVYNLLDAALKASEAKPGLQMVEREFGVLEIHSTSVESVKNAGETILDMCGLSITERLKPTVVSSKIITKVNPYQAQQINKTRKGSLLLPGQSMLVFEVEPAAYIVLAANEAEKASNVQLIHFNPFGRFGRLFMAGSESDIKSAAEAAEAAIH
ncbi:MAG: BMC domain-containing protein [Desulfobacteraceae bacterium]|nr:BMC domain-containing protein [Desulfobacteraceae bacterium]